MFGHSLENWKKKIQVRLSILPATNLSPTPQILAPDDLKIKTSTITEYIIGHFRETKTLSFKTGVRAKTILCV